MSTRSGEELREIAVQLRDLLETSPREPDEVEAWVANAHAVYDRLRRDFSAVRLPIQVMHFVHDADIRARDPKYRQHQEEGLREIVDCLERGTAPKSKGLTISITKGLTVSFTTTGFVVIIVALATTIVLLVRSCG